MFNTPEFGAFLVYDMDEGELRKLQRRYYQVAVCDAVLKTMENVDNYSLCVNEEVPEFVGDDYTLPKHCYENTIIFTMIYLFSSNGRCETRVNEMISHEYDYTGRKMIVYGRKPGFPNISLRFINNEKFKVFNILFKKNQIWIDFLDESYLWLDFDFIVFIANINIGVVNYTRYQELAYKLFWCFSPPGRRLYDSFFLDELLSFDRDCLVKWIDDMKVLYNFTPESLLINNNGLSY